MKRLLCALLILAAGQLGAVDFDYRLSAVPVAKDVYTFIGKTEDFTTDNGGNIVNTASLSAWAGIERVPTLRALSSKTPE